MFKYKNIQLFGFSIAFSVIFISNGLANLPIVATTLPSKSIIYSKTDSLKSKELACNFTPSLWLRADAGVTLSGGVVSTWADQSDNSNNATQNRNNRQPAFLASGMNFNPTLDFDGVNDFLQGNAGASNTTLFMVARSDIAVNNSSAGQTIFTANIVNPASDAYFFSLGSITAAFANEVITHALGNSTEYRKARTGNFTIPATPHLYSTNHNNTSSSSNVYYDGRQIDNDISGNFINAETNRPYRVGGNLYVWGGSNFNGQISEVLSFPINLSTNDRHIIESYLGIKYGIPLTHAYLNSANQTLWNESNYSNNIASIGREDCFKLNQKQTKSTQDGAIITMGLGNIFNDNNSNTNNFSNDQSYLFWGHDNDDNGTIEEISSELPTGVKKRLDREWKVRNINAVDAVAIQFDLNGINHSGTVAGDFFLLIDNDSDSDFTSGTVQKIAASTFQNGIISFTDISFQSESIISLATESNNAPQVSCPIVNLEVCPNGNTYLFANGVQVQDLDNDNLTAQITIAGITDNKDSITVDLTDFIGTSQNFNYPNLTISGAMTASQLQSILRTLQFSTTSSLVGTRVINILSNDGIEDSNTVTKEIQANENFSICCSADAPIISN